MTPLDNKTNEHFAGLVVRKDLVKTVKGNAIVPSYVLEYLLGQYCATSDEVSIEAGIETVKDILAKHYVHRNEAGLVRSNIREKGRYKVIDKVSVALNDKKDTYEASFSNLGIKNVLVDTSTVKAHPKLLVSGVWCIADVEYEYSEDKSVSPWILGSLKPIQMSNFDYEGYLQARAAFSTDEWIDLLIQSIGFDPEMLGRRSKFIQLVRLIPFVERNYNLIELGPKGTGKSHIFSEFSPHGILISGGEVTVPKLFVNNASGKIGLVGYWDVVAFDEFAGQQKKVDKALVDIMKNYMANKSFSRGVETLGAEASMVFIGNTKHTVPYMLKHTDLFDELPAKYYDSAFIDRLHAYIPGWEVDVIRGEMFSNGYGFVVDYLAEILRHLRGQDYSGHYKEHFQLSSDISTRDRDAVHKTFSGLMKILFPAGDASVEEIEELLSFAMEGRKRVKDQLMRIDATYPRVEFSFTRQDGTKRTITTLEEQEYPRFYYRTSGEDEDADAPVTAPADVAAMQTSEPRQDTALNAEPARETEIELKSGHREIQENQRGISYANLFGAYLRGASVITIQDPFLRLFHQLRNLSELLELIVVSKQPEEEISVRVVTGQDEESAEKQVEDLHRIAEYVRPYGIDLEWTFDDTIHDRSINTDTGWKIVLGRGLDIYQRFDSRDAYNMANRLQETRSCKAFGITFVPEPPQ
jgi:ATP-dependent Lon protease